MKRPMKPTLLALSALFITLFPSACTTAPSASDADLWWSHVAYLASDDLRGRFTGTPDYDKAAAYVADQFRALEVQPAGADGYFQSFDLETRTLDPAQSTIELVANGKTTALKIPDEAVLGVGGTSGETVEAPIIFAGYGLTVAEANYDDYANLPTKGAVSATFYGAPKAVPSLMAAHFSSGRERAKVARAKGLAGSLRLLNPRVVDLPWPRYVNAILQTSMQPTGPEFGGTWNLGPGAVININAIDKVLAGTGHTFEELAALDVASQPLPHFPLKASVRMKPVFHSGHVQSANVVGVIPGSDPQLKNEYVLLSAHLDHVGIGEPVDGDDLYNGAMDNASGVATLLEVARMLRASGPPKRSVILLACTAEEVGEWGSQYFAEHPTVDGKQIVANINLDMYLPLFPLKILRAYGLGESTLAAQTEAAAKEIGVEVQDDPEPERNTFIRSDQYSFILKGIPALFLSFGYNPGTPEEEITNQWFEKRYHAPSDDLNQPVDKEAAATFNHLMTTLTRNIADAPNRPAWNQDSFFRRFAK